MYVMHGDGHFRDDDKHLLNYIRSLMSRQGPGGRKLSSDPSRVDFSQVSTGQLGSLHLRKLSLSFWGPIYKISYDLSHDYRKFIVRSTYDSDLKRAEISLRNIVS